MLVLDRIDKNMHLKIDTIELFPNKKKEGSF